MEYFRFVFSSVISFLINIIPGRSFKSIQNILLIRLDHIGDMVCTLEAMQNLRREYKNAKIILVTGKWNQGLFSESSLVDEIIIYNSPVFTRDKSQITSWSNRLILFKHLKKIKFELIVDFRSDYFMALISLMLFPALRKDRGTVRIIAKFKSISNKLLKKNNLFPVHEIETNKEIVIGLLHKYEISNKVFNFSDKEISWLYKYLKEKKLKEGLYSILHPGASWEYKRWDYKNFREVGKFLYDKYGLKSFIIGTKDEYEIGEKISFGKEEFLYNIIGKTSLRQTMILIKYAAAVICNDSSPMQIASRMDVPTIAILGPSEVKKFAPLGSKVIYFHKHIECNPCSQITCKYPALPCVNLNSVSEIESGIDNLLK